MKKILSLLVTLLIISSCTTNAPVVEETPVSSGESEVSSDIAASPENTDTQMSETDTMKDKIAESPRHQEWVEIDNNGKTIHAFVVYPEEKIQSAAVVMIHENKGLNDWARNEADQIAAEGYIVVAPDLLSSFDEERQKTSDFDSPDDATEALYSLDQDVIDSDMKAVSDYARSIESFNGNLVSAGYCWGGTQSYNIAAGDNDIQAALVFYGTAPTNPDIYDQIDVPVYAFYGENDQRVNATIADTEENMNNRSKAFSYEIYPGAGHAFMRNAESEDADEPTIEASENAFERMKEILEQYK